MSLPAQFIQVPDGGGKTYSAVGDKYTVLASGDQTAGAYLLIEAVVPPGGGPPPHFHTREEESFYVLDGEITFTIGDRTIVGTPGTPHAFKNCSGSPSRMLILCTPAGFESFLAEFGTELPARDAAPIPPSKEEIEKLLTAAPKYGIVMLPPKG